MEFGFRRAITLGVEADWKVDGSDTFLYSRAKMNLTVLSHS